MKPTEHPILLVAIMAGALALCPVHASAEPTLELSISCLDGPFDQNDQVVVGEVVTANLAGFPPNTIGRVLSVVASGPWGSDVIASGGFLGTTDALGNLSGVIFSASQHFTNHGVYTVTIYGDANNSFTLDPGEVQASDTITVPCPQVTPQDIVDQLGSAGLLSAGEVNSLTAKLDAAAQRAAAGNARAAINQLNAFINEVRAMMKSGRLTTEQGQALIDAAQLAIADL